MSPARKAVSARDSTTSALSCSWPVVPHSSSAAAKSASARSTAPSARWTVARRVSERATQITSPACRSTGTARRTSSSASPWRPSTQNEYARRYSTRARVCAEPRPTPRSRAARPCRVRPACTSATPSVASTSASRSAEPARAARSRARRRCRSATARSPKSRCQIPITWWATDACSGGGPDSRSRSALRRATSGLAKTIGSSSRTLPFPAVTCRIVVPWPGVSARTV